MSKEIENLKLPVLPSPTGDTAETALTVLQAAQRVTGWNCQTFCDLAPGAPHLKSVTRWLSGSQSPTRHAARLWVVQAAAACRARYATYVAGMLEDNAASRLQDRELTGAQYDAYLATVPELARECAYGQAAPASF